MKKILFGLSVLALILSGCGGDKEEKKTTPQNTVSNVKTTKDSVDVKVQDSTNTVKVNVGGVNVEVSADTPKEITGQMLYAKCVSCHGKNGEIKALNKSEVIAGWSVKKLEDSLKGYKNGTYGGSMKSIMVGQVANLSDEEITKVSEYISKM